MLLELLPDMGYGTVADGTCPLMSTRHIAAIPTPMSSATGSCRSSAISLYEDVTDLALPWIRIRDITKFLQGMNTDIQHANTATVTSSDLWPFLVSKYVPYWKLRTGHRSDEGWKPSKSLSPPPRSGQEQLRAQTFKIRLTIVRFFLVCLDHTVRNVLETQSDLAEIHAWICRNSCWLRKKRAFV